MKICKYLQIFRKKSCSENILVSSVTHWLWQNQKICIFSETRRIFWNAEEPIFWPTLINFKNSTKFLKKLTQFWWILRPKELVLKEQQLFIDQKYLRPLYRVGTYLCMWMNGELSLIVWFRWPSQDSVQKATKIKTSGSWAVLLKWSYKIVILDKNGKGEKRIN